MDNLISIILTATITCLVYELIHGILEKFRGRGNKNAEKKRR